MPRNFFSAEIDIESPGGGQELLYRGCIARRVLPLRLHRCWCCCCCLCAKFLPREWLIIRDWTHMVLVSSVPSFLIFTAASIVFAFGRQTPPSCWRKEGCFPEMLGWLYCVVCVVRFAEVVGRYDQHLINREQEVRAHRDMLLTSYSCMITDMNELLLESSSTESSAAIAETSFDARCRDFQRFLQKVKSLCENHELEDSSEAELLLSQFKVFVMNWLQIISESSIDPVNSPRIIIHPDVVSQQASLLGLIGVLLEKLQSADLNVITSLRESHQQILRRCQCMVTKQIVDAESSFEGPRTPWLSKGVSSNRCCPSWISCSSEMLFKCCFREGRTEFPKGVHFLCIRLGILSQEHLLLLVTFGLGWMFALLILLTSEALVQLSLSTILIVLIFIVEFCNYRWLISFEDLHTIRQLQDETKELAKARDEATNQIISMRTCWDEVANIQDVWLHRTIPCLDLYHDLHDHLEDSARGDMVIFMVEINRIFGSINNYLHGVEMWKGSTIPKEEKQRLGKGITSLCGESDFGRLLTTMQNMVTDGPMYEPQAA